MAPAIFDPPYTWRLTASPHESVFSSSYRWDSSRRGRAPQVILQRTFAGSGQFRVRDQIHPVGPSQMFITMVPEAAEYWFDPDIARFWRFQWLNLNGSFAQSIWGSLRDRFGPVVPMPENSAASLAMTRLIHDVESGQLANIELAAQACYGFFIVLWRQLEGRDTGVSPPVAQLQEQIRSRFRDPVNIKELCGEVGLSREHLSREFRRVYGLEPGAYLRRLRLEAAEVFLQQTLLGIDEIAARTGFSNGRQFARFFRNQTGRSPTVFREAMRSG